MEIRVKALLLALALAVPANLRAESPKTDLKPVRVTWDEKVPMRDGVKLSATIYRDPTQLKPLPVILTMTPYIAEHAAKQGAYFAQNGYVFVAMDLRGRGNSEGTFIPGQVEAKDGYDAVEWLAKQPWCDGQVATWGGSWLGFNQWSLAKEFPPHLKALAPTAAVHPGVDYPHPNGIPNSYMLRWLTYVHGRALNSGLFAATTLWNNAEWEQVTTRRPFKDLEAITGIQGTEFQTWLQHPREDAFWQAMTPRPEHYAKLRIPILTITGHYDADQVGALTYYERHMAHGQPDITQRHWIIIGPWDHSGTRRPKAELGGVAFGPGAVMSMEALHKAWYDHVLKGGPRPEFLENRVACFIMGRNTWIHAASLSKIEGSPLKLELDLAGAQPGDVTHGGQLSPNPPSGPGNVTLVADPGYLPPRMDLEEENAQYLRDQRNAFNPLPSQVLWHSEPFREETILAGRPKLTLRLACDQPDADLWASLQEVLPDGSAISLSSGSLRLRYRRGGIEPILMTPGQVERVDFPALDFFARALAKGSRLRLLVSAAPDFGSQRNTHTGGDLSSEPLSAARVAHITLLTGPGSGSLLELPRPDASLLKAKDTPAQSH
jgi:putative CocE/NonD family hydrolase